MNIKTYSIIAVLALAMTFTAAAQSPKGAEQLRSTKRAPAPASEVDGKFPILSSHIKSLGTIGRYEIASAKVRGLDTPNVTALLALDKETGQLAVLASGNSPGLGVAIVNGGANVGGSFLFGAKIRPDRTSVNNNSDADAEAESEGSYSRSEGGDAVSVSKGGAGGNALSVSSADADAKSASVSSVKNSNSNTSKNSNVNANSNKQGQAQGQIQGQSSKNSNSNHNKNTAPAPKKSRKH